jgi:N-acyl-D-aspartate/D-glutamate deacylase
VTGYARDDHEPIREMLADPGTLLGLGDGGAHVAMIVDASAPTYMLTHWGRDRKRGPGLPLEYMVKRQTSETADFFGFHDRAASNSPYLRFLLLAPFELVPCPQIGAAASSRLTSWRPTRST